MIKLPYGQSYFPGLVRGGFHFVDKSEYLEKMENINPRFVFFLRPRRFGKSLWVSILQHYYGLEHKGIFREIFGKYYIGQHPTPLANQYLVLMFEFARIDTTTNERTYSGFLRNVQFGISAFISAYPEWFTEADRKAIFDMKAPEDAIKLLFDLMKQREMGQKIYLLIDEYDHFANEILAFRREDFLAAVGKNGFVRKFYETIKGATQQGLVERLFITGVSSLTLDSMTSGFNIGTNLSQHLKFEGMLGFTHEETEAILRGIEIPEDQMPVVFEDLKKWYDGYAFHAESTRRFYNPDMVLYFADHFADTGKYPDDMLDVNIASDYGKIRQLFQIGGAEQERLSIVDNLLTKGFVTAPLTRQFNFVKGITRSDFISLLYYQGMVTVSGSMLDGWEFRIPNEVIKQLYFNYFAQIIKERASLSDTLLDPAELIYPFYSENNPKPLLAAVETTLKNLSNRDSVNFSEKYLKAILVAYLRLSSALFIKSEPESERKYLDILLTRRPPFQAPFQFAIELKYLKKEEADKLEDTTLSARQQLQGYLAADEIARLADLKAWLFIFVGTELKVAEAVK